MTEVQKEIPQQPIEVNNKSGTTAVFDNPPEGKKINWVTLDYSWLEKEGIVEIFIDFEGASEVPDQNIDLVRCSHLFTRYYINNLSQKLLNNDELDFKVFKDGKFYRFYIDALFDKIADVQMKKKKDKFVFKMKKVKERIWYKITF